MQCCLVSNGKQGLAKSYSPATRNEVYALTKNVANHNAGRSSVQCTQGVVAAVQLHDQHASMRVPYRPRDDIYSGTGYVFEATWLLQAGGSA